MSFFGKDTKAFSTVLSGTTMAQVASFCLAPIVARLYSTEDFGIAALFFAIVTILSPASSLRYNQAVFLPREDEEASDIVKLSNILALFFSLLVLIVIVILDSFFTIKILAQLGGWIYLLPLAVFIYGETGIVKTAATRWKKYKPIASSEVARSTATPLIRIVAGAIGGSSIAGLIFSMLVSHIAGITLLWVSVKKIIFNVSYLGLDRTRTYSLIKQYRELPFFVLPTALLLTFSDNLPMLFFGQFFPASLLGILGMTRRLVRIPVNTINNALRTILIPKLVERKNQGQPLLGIYNKVVAALFCASFIPFFIIFQYGESLFSFYLGEKWTEVGKYAAYLTPLMFTQLLYTPASSLLFVLRKQKIRLFVQVLYFVVTLAALFTGFVVTKNPEKTIIFYSWGGAMVNLLGLSIGLKFALFESKVVEI